MADTNISNEELNKNKKSLMILKIDEVKKSYDILHDALDKAVKEGLFGLDETFTIGLCCNNMLTTIDTLDKYQKVVVELSNANGSNENVTDVE